MNKYYFIGSALPTLSLKVKPEMSFHELQRIFAINLSVVDMQKNTAFKRYIDITNLRLLWESKEIDPRGILNAKELEDALLIKDIFDDYVFDYLDKYESVEERLKNFNFLKVKYFEKMMRKKGFLKKYFTFERDYRLILTALRSKTLKRDVVKEVQYEDLQDDLVEYILVQKDLEDFEPPKEYQEIKDIYKNNIDDPHKLNEKLLEYRFKKISEIMEEKPFSIDQLLAYSALLIIVEDLNMLNKDIGKNIIDNIT